MHQVPAHLRSLLVLLGQDIARVWANEVGKSGRYRRDFSVLMTQPCEPPAQRIGHGEYQRGDTEAEGERRGCAEYDEGHARFRLMGKIETQAFQRRRHARLLSDLDA